MQMSVPLPGFSTILGILSACAGKEIHHTDTRIGFEFHCSGTSLELERTTRLEYTGGRLAPHREGQSLLQRQVLLNPQLDIYVTNLSLLDAFRHPASTPTMGRSQDLAWVEFAREVALEPRATGKIGPTLLPESFPVPGLILRLPEWMGNEFFGVPRFSGPFTKFKTLLPYGTDLFDAQGEELYHPSDSELNDHVVHIHKWMME
jgi:CRISPR-associated protein Cas5t